MSCNSTSAQLELLRPLITPAIRKLALRRYKAAQNLFNETLPLPEHEVRTALLLVRIMNPLQNFSEAEEALMRGISAKTLRGRKARREVPRFP